MQRAAWARVLGWVHQRTEEGEEVGAERFCEERRASHKGAVLNRTKWRIRGVLSKSGGLLRV